MPRSASVFLLYVSQQKAVQYCGESIPEARSSFSVEIANMILFLHNLIVFQIAIFLMQCFMSWRGFIYCHTLLTRYVYMYVSMHVSYQNVPYCRLCTRNIGVRVWAHIQDVRECVGMCTPIQECAAVSGSVRECAGVCRSAQELAHICRSVHKN